MSEALIKLVTSEIMGTIVMHTRFNRAYVGILDIIKIALATKIPLGATVIAPSGCGKTALINCLTKAIPSRDPLYEGIRSISVSAEANSTIGHLVSGLMKGLGYPPSIRASTLYEQSSLLASALRERGVIVVFIDESQHIFRGKRSNSAAAITDWIKQISDEGEVVVVMLGTREMRPLFEFNEQLGSRAPAHFELREFERNAAWIGLLKKISETVTKLDLSAIFTNLNKPLHLATGGALRPLKQLLLAGAMEAIEKKSPTLEQIHLASGYEKIFGADPRIPNPFLED